MEARYGGDCAVDLLVAVCERDEHRLELRGRDVDPTLEQMAEERAVALGVAAFRVLEVRDDAVGHEQREHRAHPTNASERGEPGLEPRSAPLELLVHLQVAQAAEHG